MTPEQTRRVARLRRFAVLMDSAVAVPGTRWRVGLDAVVGLIPGVGDSAGLLLSAWVVLEAWRLGVSRGTLLRMAANVAVDAVVGTVPVLGDLFDAGFKANQRNVRLLERELEAAGGGG